MQVLGRAVTRRGWAVVGAAAVLGLVVLVGAVVVLVNAVPRLVPGTPDCTVEVGGREVGLSTEQAETAATISAAVVRRGLPARAASVAVATAWAERDLERPGKVNAWLDALGDVPDYRSMQVEEAAAAVDGASREEDDYAEHAAETGAKVPPEPLLFTKATSCICGPNDDLELPRNSHKTDWAVELGVVIGEHTKYVDEADALAHVVGYCVVHDVSEREFQIERSGLWDKGKGCDTFGPIGP